MDSNSEYNYTGLDDDIAMYNEENEIFIPPIHPMGNEIEIVEEIVGIEIDHNYSCSSSLDLNATDANERPTVALYSSNTLKSIKVRQKEIK